MRPVLPNRYKLRLSTGEEILVAEIDIGMLEAPEAVLRASSIVTTLCTSISREIMEEAKMGYDTRFLKCLRSPPIGCLLRVYSPRCSLFKDCTMANARECTTKNSTRKGGKFPSCWSYDVSYVDAEIVAEVREFCDAVIHSWRENHHVILVDMYELLPNLFQEFIHELLGTIGNPFRVNHLEFDVQVSFSLHCLDSKLWDFADNIWLCHWWDLKSNIAPVQISHRDHPSDECCEHTDIQFTMKVTAVSSKIRMLERFD